MMSKPTEPRCPPPQALLQRLGDEEVVTALTSAAKALESARANGDKATRAEQLGDEAREATFLHLQQDEVEECYNEAYALSSLYWAESKLLTDHGSVETARAALRAIDLAILRGGPKYADQARRINLLACEVLQEPITSEQDSTGAVATEDTELSAGGAPAAKKQKLTPISDVERESPHWCEGSASPLIEEIPRVSASELTVEQFKNLYLEAKKPVIIVGAMKEWRAMQPGGGWSDPEYLKRQAGDRLIPVEVCNPQDATQTYLTDSWERRVMPLKDYIDEFVLAERERLAGQTSASSSSAAAAEDDDKRGYLAQYGLFEQIPTLQSDFKVPAYCSAMLQADEDFDGSDEDEEQTLLGTGSVQTSAWFGPAGTVSPLHYDPYHNLLSQAVGHKYVRLYPESETDRLYPRDTTLCNNSNIDLDNVDLEQFPRFRQARGLQCVLAPGEMLHIPRHCWHYVRSLSMSFSVSFWWGARL